MKRRISDVGPRPAIDGGQRRVTRTRAAAGRGLPLCIVCTQSLRPESVASARRRGALPAVTLRGSYRLPPQPDSLALAGLPSLASHWKAAPVTQARHCWPAVSRRSSCPSFTSHSGATASRPPNSLESFAAAQSHLACRGPSLSHSLRPDVRVTPAQRLAVTRRGPSHSQRQFSRAAAGRH